MACDIPESSSAYQKLSRAYCPSVEVTSSITGCKRAEDERPKPLLFFTSASQARGLLGIRLTVCKIVWQQSRTKPDFDTYFSTLDAIKARSKLCACRAFGYGRGNSAAIEGKRVIGLMRACGPAASRKGASMLSPKWFAAMKPAANHAKKLDLESSQGEQS